MFLDINDCEDCDSVSNSSIDDEDLFDLEVKAPYINNTFGTSNKITEQLGS